MATADSIFFSRTIRQVVNVAATAFLLAAIFGHNGAVMAQTPSPKAPTVSVTFKTPDALVQNLYKLHNKGLGPIFGRKDRLYLDRYFDQRLSALLLKNIIGPPSGDVGNLDFDPLFNAQELIISNFQIGPAKTHKNKTSTVVVTFKNGDRPERITFHLNKAGSDWKIQDIDYGSGERLVKILSQPF